MICVVVLCYGLLCRVCHDMLCLVCYDVIFYGACHVANFAARSRSPARGSTDPWQAVAAAQAAQGPRAKL